MRRDRSPRTEHRARRWILACTILAAFAPAARAQGRLFDYLDNHTSIMLLVDPDTGIIEDANKAAAEFYGYPAETLRGMSITRINVLSPEEIQAEMRAAAAQRRNYFVFPHRPADGTIRTVEVYSSPVFAPAYGRQLLLSIIHDITGKSVPEAEMDAYRIRLNSLVETRARELVEARSMNAVLAAAAIVASLTGLALYLGIRGQRRAADAVRAALEDRNKLFAELQHRVKNSFATIASLIHIDRSRTEDAAVRSALEILGGRVETLSALYRLMHEGRRDGEIDLPEYLMEIARSISSAIGAGGPRLEYESRIEHLVWDAKGASSLGLILNELVTNAYKYAPQGDSGAVRVRLERIDEDLLLMVSNPGGPLPEGFAPGRGSGFGLLMITELVRQFKGSLEVRSLNGRVEFSVRVPV